MTTVLFSDKKRGIVAGLDWRALQNHGSSNLAVKEIRYLANDHDASLIVVHAVDSGSGVQATLGMYSFDDPDEKRPRELHSLAALFVRAFPSYLNMILAWRLEHKTAVIIIQGGMPIVDAIKDHAEANSLITKALNGEFGFSGHTLFSNDTETNALAELVSEELFWPICTKATRLSSVPIRKMAVIIFMMTVLLVVGGSMSAYEIDKSRKRTELEAQMKAQDPLPAYQDALAVNINKMGLDRESIRATFAQIQNYPVWESGWLLTKIECSALQCISAWDRKGGTTEKLLRSRVGEEMMPESTGEKVQLRWKSKLTASGIGNLVKATSESVARTQNTNTFQLWRNANINVSESTELKVWPTPTIGNVGQLKNISTLRISPVGITVAQPLVAQIIDQTPAAIWWQSFVMTFSPGEKAQLLKVDFKGSTYVH